MRSLLVAFCVTGCATLTVTADDAASTDGAPIEVSGHVVSACGASEPVAQEPVAVRVAGDLEVLDSTQTDASGAFSFRVAPRGEVAPPLFIEARGVRAVARQSTELGRRGLVGELVLPCTGG
jgi:hypothetical protein